MTKLSDGERIFIIWSIINLIVLYHGVEGIGILNGDIAFGMAISWLLFLYSFIIAGFINCIIEEE